MKINWKTILLHLLFWVLYIIIWGVKDTAYAPTFLDTIDSNLIGAFIYSFGVYLNLYLLVPYLLLKRKKTAYILLVICLVLIISYITAKVFSVYYLTIDLGTSKFFGSAQGIANTSADFLVVYGLSTCLFFINEWYIKERRLRELETAKLQSELDLLKSQINPHFLFNALNSIHVLIRKSPEKAQETLEKFSELLSHQIYEVKKESIPLKEEIDNLNNFIEIQKLRQDDNVKVDWKVVGNMEGLRIAPMLFLNFVENAFKYASSNKDQVKVQIHVSVTENLVEFLCLNSINRQIAIGEVRGLGIANAKRRLEILYADTHELIVENSFDQFEVKLTLRLEN